MRGYGKFYHLHMYISDILSEIPFLRKEKEIVFGSIVIVSRSGLRTIHYLIYGHGLFT